MTTRKTCAECRFWQESQMHLGFAPCRRGPPTHLVDHERGWGRWVRTHFDEWCGEYQPATKEVGGG